MVSQNTDFTPSQTQLHSGQVHPEFEALVHRIIESVEKDRISELRRDFHARLRITLTHPDNADFIEDLWDFFYDWCIFEQRLPENIGSLTAEEKAKWERVRGGNQRGLYSVAKATGEQLKLKDLFVGKTFVVRPRSGSDFLGISRGDIIEGRLVGSGEDSGEFHFIRRPSYHPSEVHGYMKDKVKQFKKSKDFSTYQNWLWILVGMYLKHRIYAQMPIDKIYDDNSRI